MQKKFGCGKTQVNTILANKESIVEQYESNVSNDCILLRKRSRHCEFADINESLHKWYSIATAHNIYPSGPQLREKAKQIAETVDSWKERIPELVRGYYAEDILNLDETGCFGVPFLSMVLEKRFSVTGR